MQEVTLMIPEARIGDRSSSQDFHRKARLAACLEEALRTEYLADVEFIIGDERLKAHRLLLSLASPVFDVMFNGSLPESSEVVVEDINPVPFRVLLKYLYSQHPENELLSWNLDVDDMLNLLHAARKYDVKMLEDILSKHLEKQITVQSLHQILCAAKLYELKSLEEKVWAYLDTEADKFFRKDTSYLQMSNSLIGEALRRDSLSISEMKLFESLTQWAETKCFQQNMANTPENIRSVMGDAVYLIRFPTMNATEFADGPAQRGILSVEEVGEILLYICASPTSKPCTKFPSTPRSYKNPHVYATCYCMPSISLQSGSTEGRKKTCQFCSEPFFSPRPSPKSKVILTTATPPRYCACRARAYCPSVSHQSRKYPPLIPH